MLEDSRQVLERLFRQIMGFKLYPQSHGKSPGAKGGGERWLGRDSSYLICLLEKQRSPV
jgi:hypothetical protein